MTRLSRRNSGTLPRGDFLGEALDDGRLAHAGFAQQHRVVLGAAAQDLDDALDFVLAADDRVHLAFARDFRQVASEGLERGRLDFALFLRGGLFRRLARSRASSWAAKLRVEFLQNLLAGLLDINIQVLEHAGGHAVAFAQQAEQDVLGADVGVVEGLGFLGGQGEDLLDARACRGCCRSSSDRGRCRLAFRLPCGPFPGPGPSFCRTLTATPWPSLMRPSSRCSVPTKLWLKRSASLRASASTCWARGREIIHCFLHSYSQIAVH